MQHKPDANTMASPSLSSTFPTLSTFPDLKDKYPSLATSQHALLPVLVTKNDVKLFAMNNPDSHAAALDRGFAMFRGSIDDDSDVIAVMNEDMNSWMEAEREHIENLQGR
jgi:hypothetical protein